MLKIMVKILLIAVALFGFGCGQAAESPDVINAVDTSMTSIEWEGYANESEDLLLKFNEVKDCINGSLQQPSISYFHVRLAPYPYVIEVNNWFICGDALAVGCYDMAADIIYFYDDPDVFKHEAVHRIARTLDENSEYFSCAVTEPTI